MGYVHGRHEKSVWRGRRGDTMSGEMRETGWRMGRERRRRRRGRRKHENTVVVGVRAMSSGQHEEEDGGEEEEASTSSFVLPIFPLSLVALPDGMVRRKMWTRSVLFSSILWFEGKKKGREHLSHTLPNRIIRHISLSALSVPEYGLTTTFVMTLSLSVCVCM